ncbi:MAG TPA: hypothetical protein VJ963_11545, partial [Bacteroidales bacterium]|nr:hypothetical protein [Bacteroidales bacterium]
KNNNFILRYNSVRTYDNDFIMVILYRDPLIHAASLLEKHREFKKLQEEDPFVLEYMNWLGHHEFGLNQKAFSFNGRHYDSNNDKDSMDYWLEAWINYYSYALTIDHPHTLIINYGSYCAKPEVTVKSILENAGLSGELPDYKPFNNKRKTVEKFSEKINERAQEIYIQLCELVKT